MRDWDSSSLELEARLRFLELALAASRTAHLDEFTARFLREWGYFAWRSNDLGDPRQLWTESRDIFERIGNAAGVIDTTSDLADFLAPSEALIACHKMASY